MEEKLKIQENTLVVDDEMSADQRIAKMVSDVFVLVVNIGLPLILLISLIYIIVSNFQDPSILQGSQIHVKGLVGGLFPIVVSVSLYARYSKFLKSLNTDSPIQSFLMFLLPFVFAYGTFMFSGLLSREFPILELAFGTIVALVIFGNQYTKSGGISLIHLGIVTGFSIYIMFWGIPVSIYN
jgi:hypothetical protein